MKRIILIEIIKNKVRVMDNLKIAGTDETPAVVLNIEKGIFEIIRGDPYLGTLLNSTIHCQNLISNSNGFQTRFLLQDLPYLGLLCLISSIPYIPITTAS